MTDRTDLALRDIPSYALYGEAAEDPAADWIHCETIQSRSRLHNYRILPHRHEKLFQILHLARGTADMALDGQSTKVTGPAIVTLPPMTVHGYRFSPDVQGTVLTLFDSRLAHILADMDGVRETFRSVQLIGLQDHADATHGLADDIRSLTAEFAGRASGRSEAIQARLLLVLITLHRIRGSGQKSGAHIPGRRALQHALRFRELVDQDFRKHHPIEAYARRLGLTPPHLNRICREHLGDTALGVVHQRIILEAKRYLTFTGLSAKEIALALAFDDPAYFARFFKQKTGLPPLAFRAVQQSTLA
ncbi:helix-turn-helix domain-containing protein [Microvirga lotononidis]|uniref:DNA-binding domain-containing protein, AraC-type n=1 Tax=Microvirga lotononidis TaxID=864069 RepID=I4Z0K6_9HYPH|nr:helix-turn-helix domain-containing protein [Microvirga lotononidis]EIM29748.1 DNA-binding domain-containing protein, AraC-type [Microvirga lotononidis]WQO26951.1 helix-turn-helix domain-containing protein [Microvirga lotononidis]